MTSQKKTNAYRRWKLQDAKAHFSEVVERAMTEGPQVVTRRGEETVVVVQIDAWREQASPYASIKEWLLAPTPRGPRLPIPKRGKMKMRPPPDFSN